MRRGVGNTRDCTPSWRRHSGARPWDGDVAPALQVELDVEGSTCRLTLRGELCGGSLATLAAQVDRLGCIPCEQVVVDMRQVTELDPAGARVILGLHYYVRGRGGVLRVTGDGGRGGSDPARRWLGVAAARGRNRSLGTRHERSQRPTACSSCALVIFERPVMLRRRASS